MKALQFEFAWLYPLRVKVGTVFADSGSRNNSFLFALCLYTLLIKCTFLFSGAEADRGCDAQLPVCPQNCRRQGKRSTLKKVPAIRL